MKDGEASTDGATVGQMEKADNALKAKNGEQDNRLDGIDKKNETQDNRLDGIDKKNETQDNRLDGIDKKNETQDNRLDGIDKKNETQDNRLDGIDKKNETQDNRLDGIDKKNETQDNRLNGIDHKNAIQDNRLNGLDNRVDALDHRVDNLDSRIDEVGAGAAALAALHPLDFDPDAKWDFAAGYGNYRGENAVAVGTFYRPNEDTMFSVGGTFGNDDNMINAGVSFKIGAGSSHVTTSRTAMAKEIKSMRDIVAKQDAQIQKLTAMVNALVGVQTETDTRRPCSRMYRKTTGHTKLSQPWLRAAWSRAIRTANSRATAT